MTQLQNASNDTVTIRDRALGFAQIQVNAMSAKLVKAFERRDAFEASNGVSLSAKSSYTVERDRMLKNKVAVARLFLALTIEPCDVIERKVSSDKMFNAKALKKITEIAQLVCGIGAKLEMVTRAFIACALVATDRNVTVITNEVNRRFLCSAGFENVIADQELIDYLNEQRHSAMTSGAETQSSQARNVLDVLGLGEIKSVNKSRDAIELHVDHDFFALFRDRYMK